MAKSFSMEYAGAEICDRYQQVGRKARFQYDAQNKVGEVVNTVTFSGV